MRFIRHIPQCLLLLAFCETVRGQTGELGIATPKSLEVATVCKTITDESPNPKTECVFPFTWKNKQHTKCTKEDFEKYWCGTKADGISSTDGWGVCDNTCEQEVEKTAPKVLGKKPVEPASPVALKGCTTVDDQNTPSPKTKCLFPFTWRNSETKKEETFHQCTKVDFDNFWCATHAIVSSTEGWGICENTCATLPDVAALVAGTPFSTAPMDLLLFVGPAIVGLMVRNG